MYAGQTQLPLQQTLGMTLQTLKSKLSRLSTPPPYSDEYLNFLQSRVHTARNIPFRLVLEPSHSVQDKCTSSPKAVSIFEKSTSSIGTTVARLRKDPRASFCGNLTTDVSSKLKEQLIRGVLFHDIQAILGPASREYLHACLDTLQICPHEMLYGFVVPLLALQRLNEFQLEVGTKLVLELDDRRLHELIVSVAWNDTNLSILLKALKKRVSLNATDLNTMVKQLKSISESRSLSVVFLTIAKFYSEKLDDESRSQMIKWCQTSRSNTVMTKIILSKLNS